LYVQVFVDELFQDVCSYSSLTLFHTNILYPSSVIDQQYQTRPLMAEALAVQFFGSYVRQVGTPSKYRHLF
jgi:transcription initiation factor TFIID subunit 2